METNRFSMYMVPSVKCMVRYGEQKGSSRFLALRSRLLFWRRWWDAGPPTWHAFPAAPRRFRISEDLGVSKNGGSPIAAWFIMENAFKWMILRYPYFRNPPISDIFDAFKPCWNCGTSSIPACLECRFQASGRSGAEVGSNGNIPNRLPSGKLT